MVHGDYRIHLSEEKNNYIVIRQNFPRLMIYVTIKGREYELTKLTLLDNCSASVLGKVLIEFELYLIGEIGHSFFLDDSRINGWHHE
jgi:hypothetical protein